MRKPFVIPPDGLVAPGRGVTRIYPGAPTIADLVRADHRLEVGCGHCHRRALIPPVLAAWLVGPSMPIAYAAVRFRCSVCGAVAGGGWITSRGCTEDRDRDGHAAWLGRADLHASPHTPALPKGPQ